MSWELRILDNRTGIPFLDSKLGQFRLGNDLGTAILGLILLICFAIGVSFLADRFEKAFRQSRPV